MPHYGPWSTFLARMCSWQSGRERVGSIFASNRPPVVARSPDRATGPDRRSPFRHAPGRRPRHNWGERLPPLDGQPAVAAAKDAIPGKAATQPAVAAASNAAKSPDAVTAGAAAAGASTATASNRDNLYRNPNGNASQQQPARRYDARDPRDPYARPPYQQGYNDYYGYTTRYGERDPYYRNPYSRPQYNRVPPDYYYYYYYLRRR